MPAGPFDRIGMVVHPSRTLEKALATVHAWAGHHGVAVAQVDTPGQDREVAPFAAPEDCDVLLALGGDGTTLAALHAGAPVGRPVMGVACGSLGALTAVTADRLDGALDRMAEGTWTALPLPGLVAEREGARLDAFNDLVLVRAGAGQVAVEIEVDGERFIRFAGDGLVASTPLGSTAYTLAAGGPMLLPGAAGLVLTPLAPHGGVCPPLVTTRETEVLVTLNPGHGGARVEVDGQVRRTLEPREPEAFALRYEPHLGDLVVLEHGETLVAGLRRRRILLDSPRVLARDDREAAAAQKAAAAAGS
jgi:NAD+ kinase